MATKSYLDVCAEIAQRNEREHRQKVALKKWHEKRLLASKVALGAMFLGALLFIFWQVIFWW